jgi:hypothetical protein
LKPTRVALFCAAYLTLQIALPASYYGSDHPEDERFSWRMFSTQRMRACRVELAEQAAGSSAWTQVDLAKALPRPWITHLQRGQRRVTEKLLRERCRGDALAVRLKRSCRETDGTRAPPEIRSLECKREATAR